MKILIINNTLNNGGGIENYIFNLQRLLSESHDVRIFGCFNNSVPSNEKLKFASHMPKENSLSGPQMITDCLSYFWNNKAAITLRRYLWRFRPDVVHIHSYHGHLTSSILYEIEKLKIPIVQTLHSFINLCPVETLIKDGKFCDECTKGGFRRALKHRCNRNSFLRSGIVASESYLRKKLSKGKVSQHICVSDYQRGIYEKYDAVNKYSTVENFCFPNYDRSLTRNEDFLLYPTRLIEGKGILPLLRLYSNDTGGKLPPVKLAGSGPYEALIRKQVDDLGLQNRIFFCGFMQTAQLNLLYSQALAVLNFSELNETFGLTVIEAMASNKFTFVSNNGALPTLINDCTGSIIDLNRCDKENIDLISEKLSKIRITVGDQIFREFQSRFSPEIHLAKLQEMYLGVLS